jgi:hypothetical protein
MCDCYSGCGRSDSEVKLAESELEYVEPDESHDGGGMEGGKDNGKAKEQESGPLPTPKAPTYEKVPLRSLSCHITTPTVGPKLHFSSPSTLFRYRSQHRRQ